MNLRPIITDEQLRDFRDGLLPEPERRLVAIQLNVDDAVSIRFDEIRAEIGDMKLAAPTPDFASKIMLQLAAEKRVQEPVYKRKSQRVIQTFFMIFIVLFIGSLLILIKSDSTTSVQSVPIDIEINWSKILNSRAFLWSVWLGCFLPAILLVFRKFTDSKRLVFVK